MKLLNFLGAIDRLGATEAERARKLGVSERTLRYWKNRAVPGLICTIAKHPDLARALVADAQVDDEGFIKAS